MNVAIVTFEFEGLTRNAGIGTAYRRLTELLVAEGHRVTVVFMPVDPHPRWARRISSLRKTGFSVVMPSEDRAQFQVGAVGYFLNRSNQVYQFLRSGSFDLVHSPDNCGLAYVSLQAKRFGREFHRTKFVIGAHGPRLWGEELNGETTESTRLMTYFDRCSMELADSLVSPSQYMVGYLRSKRWRLPREIRVIPNVNELGDFGSFKPRPGRAREVRAEALVFFGRLEARKGVFLFTEAVQRLLRAHPALGTSKRLHILFLGKDPCRSLSTTARIQSALGRFQGRIRVEFISDLSSRESLDLLKKMPEALVCMPSLADNSPYVVVEAIEAGLNFLTTRSGGQAELLAPADRAKILCDPLPESLCRALAKRLCRRPIRVRPSLKAMHAKRDWARFHSVRPAGPRAPRYSPAIKNGRSLPLISVVLDSLPSLASVLAQDYERLEICLPRSTHWGLPEELSRRARVTRFPGRSGSRWPSWPNCHEASKAASGKYLLFLEEPLARGFSLKGWVQAAETAHGKDSALVASCGIAPPTFGLSLECASLWDLAWVREACRRAKAAPRDDRSIARFYRELFLSGRKISFFPQVVLERPFQGPLS